jgi:hypothetical protein
MEECGIPHPSDVSDGRYWARTSDSSLSSRGDAASALSRRIPEISDLPRAKNNRFDEGALELVTTTSR